MAKQNPATRAANNKIITKEFNAIPFKASSGMALTRRNSVMWKDNSQKHVELT